MDWIYTNIEQSDYENALVLAESLIVKYGGVYITTSTEEETWYSDSGLKIKEQITKKIYKFREEFIRVDRMYYTDRPAFVLEFSDCMEGPYEDADPFPYNLPLNEMEAKIKHAMLVEPYAEWQERAIREKWMPKTGQLMIWRNRYAIYYEWENAYLVDIDKKEKIAIGNFYGDPEIALLNAKEKLAIVVGFDKIVIYDIEQKTTKTVSARIPEWIISVDLDGDYIRILCEDDKEYKISIR